MDIDGIIFDMDGTLYLGETTLPEAVGTCLELRRRGKRLLFISNKPLEDREAYAAKLTRLGVPATRDDVLTSTYVLGRYLCRTDPALRLYVIGEKNTREELRSFGLTVINEFYDQDSMQVIDPTGVDAVVVAFDRTLTYRKINTAYQALMAGAKFYATNADKTCPLPGGAVPDAGATISALEHITGRTLELAAGKPSALMLEEAGAILQLDPERCLLIGDRLETDIRMGQSAGMHTALVLTGVTRRENLSGSPYQPEFVLDHLAELLELL